MTRLADEVKVELIGGGNQPSGVIDNLTSFSLVTDITMPSEASFEFGDDATFASLARELNAGQFYRVFLNGRMVMTGRVEASDVPLDAPSGAVARFVLRTRLSDAMYASANPSTRVRKTNLLQYILALYGDMGLVESDFVFRPSVATVLKTGRPTKVNASDFEIRIRNLKVQEARIRPPETIFNAVDRQLRRFGLMHWDGPDGKIVIGFPNQDQDPLYRFYAYRNSDRAFENNIIAATRAQDYSGVASFVTVAGRGGKRGFSRARVSSFAIDDDVINRGFYRPISILAEGIANQQAADNAAERELSARVKNKNVVNVEMDGLSFWDGGQRVPYAVDTMAQVESDVAGGDVGGYYIHRVEMTRDANQGDITRLTGMQKGLWKLFPDAYEGKLRRG